MSSFISGPVSVSVPATSANLGPGFDALALALDLRDVVTAEVIGPLSRGHSQVTVSGEGADTVPRDADHLLLRSMVGSFEAMDVPAPGVRVECRNRIPHGRGLGSSAAAIVAGVWLARALLPQGSRLMDDDDAFGLAAEIEGHPDNVAAATYGGVTIAYRDAGRFRAVSTAADPRVRAVVFLAPEPVETRLARAMLPEAVPHRVAAENAGRAALLVAALGGHPELLLAATEDGLHQDYRAPLLPGTLALMHRLRAGGIAAVVSGAGPSVLALTDSDRLASARAEAPPGWRVLTPALSSAGALVSARAL